MKNIFIVAVLFSVISYSQTTTIDFETLNDGYTVSATEGSGFEDVFNRFDGSSYSGGDIGGNSSFVWAIEDLNTVSDPTMNLSQINVSGSTSFTFSIDMLAHHFDDWDNNDELLISYSLDGGAHQNLMWIQNTGDQYNAPAALDTDFDGNGDCGVLTTLPSLSIGTSDGCTVSSSDFKTFVTSSITLNNNNTLDIKLQFNGFVSGDEGMYLDNIIITESSEAANPTISFDSSSSSVTETDSDVDTSGIPITMTNYAGSNVTITPTVNGSSTAEAGDYTIDLSTISFDANETLNIPLIIKDDADFNNETLIVNFTVTSGIADLGTSQHTITINDDEVPLLIISEIADPTDPSGRFVEIYNTGDNSLDLSSLQVYFVKSVNAGSSYSQKALSGTIEPNQVMVIANSTDMNDDYGFSPDISYADANGNGDDAYALYIYGDRSTGILLDAYGVQGVDGTAEAWEYEDSRAIRNNPKSASPNATWTSGEWTISSADLADTTPGSLENEFRYDGDWKPRDVYANSSTSDDIYISSSLSITGDLFVDDFELKSEATLTIEPSGSLNVSTLENNGSIVMQSSSSISAALKATSISGSGTYKYQKYVAGSSTNDLITAPFSGETFSNLVGNNSGVLVQNTSPTSEYLFGPFDNDTGAYLTYDSTTNASIVLSAGQGYRAGTASGATLEFTGTFETTGQNVAINVGSDGTYGKWNLVGNPFPSYLDLDGFISDNSAILEDVNNAVYAYDGDDSDGSNFTIYHSSNSSGVTIAPGQAFFVASSSSGGDLVFNTSRQTVSGGDDFLQRQTQTIDSFFKLNLESSNSLTHTDFYFNSNASEGLDIGYDVGTYANLASSFSLYSKLASGEYFDNKFAVQTISNDLSETVVIPLGVHTSAGQNQVISIEDVSILESVNVYLKDYETGALTLLNNGAYSFSTDNTLEGISRFELRLTNTTLGIESDELMMNFKAVYQNGGVVLVGDFMLDDKVEIYDIMGRLTQKYTISNNHSIEISKGELATGVYLAKINRKGNSETIKFIVK